MPLTSGNDDRIFKNTSNFLVLQTKSKTLSKHKNHTLAEGNIYTEEDNTKDKQKAESGEAGTEIVQYVPYHAIPKPIPRKLSEAKNSLSPEQYADALVRARVCFHLQFSKEFCEGLRTRRKFKVHCFLSHTVSDILEFYMPLEPEALPAFDAAVPGVHLFMGGDRYLGCVQGLRPQNNTCEGCNKDVIFPYLRFRIYQQVNEEGQDDPDRLPYVFFGDGMIDLLNSEDPDFTTVENMPMALFYKDELESGVIVANITAINVQLHGNGILTTSFGSGMSWKNLKVLEQSNRLGSKDREKILTYITYYNPSDLNVQEGYVARSFYCIPRQYFYLNNSDRVNATEDWMRAQLRFAFMFMLGKNEVDVILQVNKLTENTVESEWINLYASTIVQSMTLFVSRMTYRHDVICYNKNGQEVKAGYEQYSGDELTKDGFYDCEDGAWLVGALLQCVQEYGLEKSNKKNKKNKKESDPFLLACAKILDLYVITNAVNHSFHPRIVEISSEEANASFYHMTCLLIPKEKFISMIKSTEFKKEFPHDILYNRFQSVPKVEDGLRVLYGESTTSVSADPRRKNVFGENLEIENRCIETLQSAAEKGFEPFVIPVGENIHMKFYMYEKFMAFNTDILFRQGMFKKADTPERISKMVPMTTEFVAYTGEQIQHGKKVVGTIKVNDLLDSNNTKNSLLPGVDISCLVDSLQTLEKLEPPKIELTINKIEFENAFRNVSQSPNYFSCVFTEAPFRIKDTPNIPFLPWNCTFSTEKCKLNPLYIQQLP